MNSGKLRVIVCDPLEAEVLDELKVSFEVEVIDGSSEDELCRKICDADAVIVRSRTKITRKVLESAHRLKAIGRPGVGLDNVDADAAREKGIKVFNSPEASTAAVAEYVCGAMICVARKLNFADRKMRGGIWAKKECMGRNIEETTLGIIGFGRIGKRVGAFGKALGMHVVAYDAFADDKMRTEAGTQGITMRDSVMEILKESDFITLHVPLTDETRHMISARALAMMRNGAIIVNASRGGVIDEDALSDALSSGKIGGAALDVFEKEPYSGKLTALDNVLLTPHIGGNTTDAQLAAGMMIVEKLRAALK